MQNTASRSILGVNFYQWADFHFFVEHFKTFEMQKEDMITFFVFFVFFLFFFLVICITQTSPYVLYPKFHLFI